MRVTRFDTITCSVTCISIIALRSQRRWSSFFFSSRRRHTRYIGDWSSDVCSSDLFRVLDRGPRSQARPDSLEHADRVARAAGIAAQQYLGRVGPDDRDARQALRRERERSEERRVGKEGRSRWSKEHELKLAVVQVE